jgi:hypothetical protein
MHTISTSANVNAVRAAIAVVCALIAIVVMATAATDRAEAAFGDDYGIAPINDGPGPADEAPAYPGTRAFWAGGCDIAKAPGFGAPIPGGVGTRPNQILVPDDEFAFPPQKLALAPLSAAHCLDQGAPSTYKAQPDLWQSIPYVNPFVGPVTTPAGDYAPVWRLPAVTQAGARPDGTTVFHWTRDGGLVDGSVDNIVVELPPGFVGDPTAVPACTHAQFGVSPPRCPPETQIGILRLNIEGVGFGSANTGQAYDTTYPVYNVEPRPGRAAELGFAYASGERAVTVRVSAKARTNGDFGVTAFTGQIPAALSPISQSITIWGVPWAAANDVWRAPQGMVPFNPPCAQQQGGALTNYIPFSGLSPSCSESYKPSWGPIRPFLANPMECDDVSDVVALKTDSFQNPGAFTTDGDPALPPYPWPFPDASADEATNWKTYVSASPPVIGCEKVGFDAEVTFHSTSTVADSASGLRADITLPQNDDPPASVASDPGLPLDHPQYDPAAGAPGHWRSDAGLATSHLDKTVVELPKGLAVNPSSATGLEACSDAIMGLREDGNPPLFNNTDPTDGVGVDCPDGSRLGTVEATTPVLDETLTGDFVLGEPRSTDPQSGEMFRTFLVLRNKERGLVAKVFGSAVADPVTGQLIATFDNNPRVPVETVDVDLNSGPRGQFANFQRCSTAQSVSRFWPWSRAHLPEAQQDPVEVVQDWVVDQDCDYGFDPGLNAGMSTPTAIASGAFSFEFTRPQGDQWVSGLMAELPPGLLASVKDFPLCTSAQASAGSCPAASRIGMVDASAGSGDPFVLEEKGEIFLTEGYKGGEYGLLTRVRAVAGPFRGAMELTPIVVRQAIHVDRRTAQVTAVSDPFPTIWHGIPLRVRRVLVKVDRPAFMRNPSDCSAKQVKATLTSTEGATASPAVPFQARGCAGLPFRPKLAMRLTGKKQTKTGGHPGVRAVVTQKAGEAGIERAEVRLPLALALDPDNAQALCEFVDGTKPDLENHCPKGSIVGRARAVSPLLNDPLVGNVYFVKNVRTDPKTGNQIRTLPMIIVALRGEIAVNLRGESDVKSRKLVSTFANVPDAPVDRFNLNINGGRNGILVVTRNRRGGRISLCRGKQVAEADMDGQNGRRFDRDIRMKTPCKAKKSAKRKSKRAAPRRRR